VPGRKRGLAVDVLGLVVAVVVVLAASAHENTAGIALLDRVAAQAGTVRTALADQVFKNAVTARGAALGIDVRTVSRADQVVTAGPGYGMSLCRPTLQGDQCARAAGLSPGVW
jgi:hypothetical protein